MNGYDDTMLPRIFAIINQLSNIKKEENTMDNNGKFGVSNRQIIIKCASEEEMLKVKEMIYYQLVGNQDYIDCNIILNGSDDRLDETKNEVHVYFFTEAETIPELKINFDPEQMLLFDKE